MAEEQLVDLWAWHAQDIVCERERDWEDLAFKERHIAILKMILEVQQQLAAMLGPGNGGHSG